LKKEQYLLNALLGNTPDAIYFKDKESKFIRLSKSLALKFGEESSDAVVGKSDFDFFEGEGSHAQDAFEDEQRIISTGIPIIDKVEKETFENGRLHWVSTTKNPLRDEEGLVIGTFGISRDITKSKLAELEVLKQKNWIEYYFKHNSVTFIVLDQFGKINYASAGLLNKLGRVRYDDLTYSDIFIDPALSKYIDALNVGGNVNQEIELEFVLNNTSMTKTRYHCFANPEVNEDGTRNLFILEKMND
jgi:PAS domain S-box-containing protein